MKKAQVIWSTEALVDLEVIYDFLAEKSPSAAQRITENLLARAKADWNLSWIRAIQEILRGTGKDHRYFVEGNYKIIYSYQSQRQVVYIEIIFDTRQDPDDLQL